MTARKHADATAVPVETGLPTLEDFPGAQIVGGSVILDGKNMGTLMTDGTVDASPVGALYVQNANPVVVPEVQTITTVPDPIPPGVLDPSKQAPVSSTAKRAVRQRKQNEAVVEAMNSPTPEEETAFTEADAGSVAPPEDPEADTL